MHYKNVLGTPVFTVPYMGYFANYIQNPPGKYLAISAGALVLIMVFYQNCLTTAMNQPTKKRRRKKAKDDSEENDVL